jgi:hypothetical protein
MVEFRPARKQRPLILDDAAHGRLISKGPLGTKEFPYGFLLPNGMNVPRWTRVCSAISVSESSSQKSNQSPPSLSPGYLAVEFGRYIILSGCAPLGRLADYFSPAIASEILRINPGTTKPIFKGTLRSHLCG